MIRIPTLALLSYPKVHFRNRISKKEVFDFKEDYCDENDQIIKLLRNGLKNYLKSPILDVGAGIGDIAFKALSDKRVVMIDVNKISRHDYPCRSSHYRRKCDFFDFTSKERFGTLLISHTLQFIDDDIEKLNNKIDELSSEFVILILNSNNDFMGELINWTEEYFVESNPESRILGFPVGYSLIKSEPFTALLKCPDYKTLAKQVAYLMLMFNNSIFY